MYIKKIETNLKGLSGEFELGQRTLIVGPNESGKSALVQAIELISTGRVGDVRFTNEVAKDLEIIRSLLPAGAQSLFVNAEWSDGKTIIWQAVLKGTKFILEKEPSANSLLPLRDLKENVFGRSGDTIRKYFLKIIGKDSGVSTDVVPDNLKEMLQGLTQQLKLKTWGEIAAQCRVNKLSENERVRNLKANTSNSVVAVSDEEFALATDAREKSFEELNELDRQLVAAIDATTAREALVERPFSTSAVPSPKLILQKSVIEGSLKSGKCVCCGKTVDEEEMQERLEKITSKIGERESKSPPPPSPPSKHAAIGGPELAELKSKVDKARRIHMDAHANYARMKTERDIYSRSLEARRILNEAETSALAWKQLENLAQGEMDRELRECVAGFETLVQAGLDSSMGVFKLLVGEGSNCSFGLVQNGAYHISLSGSARARVLSAMANAIAEMMNAGADEAGADITPVFISPDDCSWDEKNLISFLNAWSEDNSNSAAQIVVATTTKPSKYSSIPNWHVIEMGDFS